MYRRLRLDFPTRQMISAAGLSEVTSALLALSADAKLILSE
ncbi:hypothetical protein CRENPOLYSF2_460005 [Crenothrix polyspora]|uniref:Uncharacterized protein n=1 Tax=Crenothrix polyspora TaxID=360316 RepID=A0A1R4HFV9_9GAMM|nr:hypothetical protein CRENPOLYSF2_460005 [Crenothrix polyspora]